jgi:hypothetical protein
MLNVKLDDASRNEKVKVQQMKSGTAQVVIPIASLIHKLYIAIIFPQCRI